MLKDFQAIFFSYLIDSVATAIKLQDAQFFPPDFEGDLHPSFTLSGSVISMERKDFGPFVHRRHTGQFYIFYVNIQKE